MCLQTDHRRRVFFVLFAFRNVVDGVAVVVVAIVLPPNAYNLDHSDASRFLRMSQQHPECPKRKVRRQFSTSSRSKESARGSFGN